MIIWKWCTKLKEKVYIIKLSISTQALYNLDAQNYTTIQTTDSDMIYWRSIHRHMYVLFCWCSQTRFDKPYVTHTFTFPPGYLIGYVSFDFHAMCSHQKYKKNDLLWCTSIPHWQTCNVSCIHTKQKSIII